VSSRDGEVPYIRQMTNRLTSLAVVLVCAALPALAADTDFWLNVTPYPGWYGPAALSRGPTEAMFRAVHSQEEWNHLWRSLETNIAEPREDAPRVDFRKFTMLIAALGTRPTGGYTVSIQNARNEASEVIVSVLEVRPFGNDCIVTDSITHPIAIALIPKTDRPVRFEVGSANFDCQPFKTVNSAWRVPSHSDVHRPWVSVRGR
jgi:hypothetical protein